jgi:hypothetical protein
MACRELTNNSYLRYKCKKLSFIARTGRTEVRGSILKDVSATKELVLQHFIYDREIIAPVST